MKLHTKLLLCLLVLNKLCYSQSNPGGQQAARTGGAARPAATIASIVQDAKKYDGYFTFYYDDKASKIYLEIDKFDKDFPVFQFTFYRCRQRRARTGPGIVCPGKVQQRGQ